MTLKQVWVPSFQEILVPKIKYIPDFYEMWHSEEIQHANYEYINWNWLPWPKIEICFNCYEICHLEQIEHANYEYSTRNWWFLVNLQVKTFCDFVACKKSYDAKQVITS